MVLEGFSFFKQLQFTPSIQNILFVVCIALIFVAIIFRKQIKGLFEDYVYDLGFSLADEVLMFIFPVLLAIPIEFGDLLAAIIIYIKEKKVSNSFVAFLVCWEALNFTPFDYIPGLGWLISIFTNVFPAVFISRIIFGKYKAAKQQTKKLEEDIDLAERLGISNKQHKKNFEKIKEYMKQDDPVDALKEAKKTDKEIAQQLQQMVTGMIMEVDNIVQSLTSQDIEVPSSLAQTIQQILQTAVSNTQDFLAKAQNAMQEEDFQTAINAAQWARKTIIDASNQVNSMTQNS